MFPYESIPGSGKSQWKGPRVGVSLIRWKKASGGRSAGMRGRWGVGPDQGGKGQVVHGLGALTKLAILEPLKLRGS